MRSTTWIVVLSVLATCHIALGQEETPPAEPEATLPEIVIEDERPPLAAIDVTADAEFPSVFPGLGEQQIDLFGQQRSLLEMPGHVSVVGPQQFRERAPIDMFEALEQEVGVTMQRTQRGAAAPFIRGLTGQQVLIMIDGIRFNNATFRAGPNQYFNTIDPGMVERLEVYRGSGGVLFGSDAIGGAINVVTRTAGNRFGDYEYVGGSWMHQFSTADLGYSTRLNVEGSSSTSSFFGGGGYLNVNNLDRGGNLGRQPWTDYAQYSGDAKVQYLLNSSTMLTAAFQHFEQEDVQRSDRFPDRLTVFGPQQRTMSYLRLDGLELCSPLADSYRLTASYHRQKEESRDQRLNTSNLDIGAWDDEQVGLTAVATKETNCYGKFTYGADWYYDDVDAEKSRYDAGTGNFVGGRTPSFPNDSTYAQLGTFLLWDYDLAPRLTSSAGVRYTYVEAKGTITAGPSQGYINPSFENWSGNIGLNYQWHDGVHVVGTITQGFRAPNLDDLVATNDNVNQSSIDAPSVDLMPENSLMYEIGLKFDRPAYHAQVFYFWNDVNNMILRRPAGTLGGDTLFLRSNRDAYLHGLEFGGEHLLCGGWSVYGTFSYVVGIDLERGEYLSRVPPTQGIAGLQWRGDCGRNWFKVYGWFVDDQDKLNFRDLNDSRIPAGGTPGFATVNISAGTMLAQGHYLSVFGENLTDRAYRVHGSGVDGAGIGATIAYQFEY